MPYMDRYLSPGHAQQSGSLWGDTRLLLAVSEKSYLLNMASPRAEWAPFF